MPQLDKELFIDYIFYILLVLIHLYTGNQINKNVIRIYARKFLSKNFKFHARKYRKISHLLLKRGDYYFLEYLFSLDPSLRYSKTFLMY
jgi:hypothetical protein